MFKAFDDIVHPSKFQKEELVFVLRRSIFFHHKISDKFEANKKGLYIIEKIYEEGAYQLIEFKR